MIDNEKDVEVYVKDDDGEWILFANRLFVNRSKESEVGDWQINGTWKPIGEGANED